MTGGKKPRKQSSPSDFPALRAFFSGYLHQDFVEEYGSAIGAAQSYVRDASSADLKNLRVEWKSWRASLSDLSAPALATALRKLGAAWAPPSVQALDALGQALLQP
jgi:hypothetical protein